MPDAVITDLAIAIGDRIAARIESRLAVQPTLTLAEVAETLGISEQLLREKCLGGEIPYVKLGPRLYRIKPADVNAYIERHYERAQ